MQFNSFVVVNTWFVTSSSIEFTCPSQPLTRAFAKIKCEDRTLYHCLKYDNNDSYTQNCIVPGPMEKGSRPTLGDDNVTIYQEYCPQNRYQPQYTFSNERNDCWYSKSNCTGEGQVVHSNGSPTQDRTCRCDYTKGYTFITTPKAGCYCVPSEEDCSCYKKDCRER